MSYHEVKWKMSNKHKWILMVLEGIIFLIGTFGTIDEYDLYYTYLVDLLYWMLVYIILGFYKKEEKNQYFLLLIGTLGFDIVTGVYCFFFGSMMYGVISSFLCAVLSIVILILIVIEFRNKKNKGNLDFY